MKLKHVTQFIALLLILVLFSNSMAYAAKKPLEAATVRNMIAQRGVDQWVRVTLADNTEAKGMIASIGDVSFGLTPKGADRPQYIPYGQVTGIHRYGLSKGAKIGICAGTGGVIVIVLALIAIQHIHIHLSYHD